MSQLGTQDKGLGSEWLTATFPLESRKVQGELIPVGWQVATRLDGGVVTALRVIEVGPGAFIAEFAQGEAGLDEVRYSGGIGIPLQSADHLDQLVAALRLEYLR